MTKRTLYLSYDGLSDQLGQSQILPYLKGLAKEGFQITVISFEKKDAFEKNEKLIKKEISDYSIYWIPLSYTKFPPVLSTLWDLWRLNRTVLKEHKKKSFQIIHCRSYITSLIGLSFKKKYKVPFNFDMRGFWADERIEGGIWNRDNVLFKKIYTFFKKKEKEFLEYSDHIVSLTEKAKIYLVDNFKIPSSKISVIPCCVDTEHFKISNYVEIERKREELKINENQFVLSYLGTIGTWYMLAEMLDFFKVLLKTKPDAIFLFITAENPENIFKKAFEKGISKENLRILKASRREVSELISLSSYSIFFIKPVFSKIASSPTKLAEILSIGIPVITNRGVGDVDEIIENNSAGFLNHDFNEMEYSKTISKLEQNISKTELINCAKENFSLEKGVQEYLKIYKALI
jgi:glycosyltransferase involved in cell wall biosynthesis